MGLHARRRYGECDISEKVRYLRKGYGVSNPEYPTSVWSLDSLAHIDRPAGFVLGLDEPFSLGSGRSAEYDGNSFRKYRCSLEHLKSIESLTSPFTVLLGLWRLSRAPAFGRDAGPPAWLCPAGNSESSYWCNVGGGRRHTGAGSMR